MKKATFYKLKTSLGRNFFYNLQFYNISDFVKCIFTLLLQIQHENNFLLTSKQWQAKGLRCLGICLYNCFNFVYRKYLETRRHLGSGLKSEKSQGYSELQEPIKTHEIGITDLVNTNYYCYYIQIACPCGLR